MSDAGLPADVLLELVKDSRTVVYATVASMALLLYDYVLTLGREIDLVWRRKMSWGKVLFFTIRYFGIVSHTFNTAVYINNTAGVEFCRHATIFQTGSSVTVLFLVELTLVIRVWLLYNRSRAIIAVLCFFYMASFATVTAMCVKSVTHQKILVRPGPYLSGCYGTIPSYFFNVLIPPAITTTLLLALTAYKTVLTLMASHGYNRPQMVRLLLRDGIFYFVAVSGVLLVNILAFHLAKQALAQVAAGFFVAIPCMVGSRMFLNLRETLLHPGMASSWLTSFFEVGATPQGRCETSVKFASPAASRRHSLEDAPPTSATTLINPPFERNAGGRETSTVFAHPTASRHSLEDALRNHVDAP